MASAYVIAEGSKDSLALRRILPPELVKDVKVVFGFGKSSAISDARTVLAVGHQPVALVVDADTDDPIQIEEQRERVRRLLANAAPGVPFEVFLAVPNLDAMLLKADSVASIPLVNDLSDFLRQVTAKRSA